MSEEKFFVVEEDQEEFFVVQEQADRIEGEYEFERYLTSVSEVRTMLDKYGVAIVPDVLNEHECESMVTGIWDYFEHVSKSWENPLSRKDNGTWREIYSLFPLHSMLFQYFSVGHSQVCWDVRQNEKVVDIFAKLWECSRDDLLVSFDGLSFSLPPEITRRGWNRGNTWYHTDQSFTRPGFECIQSWITGLDVDYGDATLGFMESSHKFHKEFADTFSISDKSDWFKLTKEQEEFYLKKECHYKKIRCPKGSMVLWDSRTIHCGVEALKTRSTSNTRAIVYVCYTPRRFATSSVIAKRIKAFNDFRMTTHWPHKGKLFGKSPRTYGKSLPEITKIEPPILTGLGRKLVGFS